MTTGEHNLKDDLVAAKISYCVALIPSEPLKTQIARASTEITKRFENQNIIDNKQFPAHISLYIGGTDRDRIDHLATLLEQSTAAIGTATLTANELYTGYGGFIGIRCTRSRELDAFANAILEVCGAVQQQHTRYRPHLLQRWPRLTEEQRALIRRYGTYKMPAESDYHLSVAQVDKDDLSAALRLAQTHLSLPQVFGIECFQLVDVGHSNEQWVVFNQWSLAS